MEEIRAVVLKKNVFRYQDKSFECAIVGDFELSCFRCKKTTQEKSVATLFKGKPQSSETFW